GLDLPDLFLADAIALSHPAQRLRNAHLLVLSVHESVEDFLAKRFGEQVIDIAAGHNVLRWLGILVPGATRSLRKDSRRPLRERCRLLGSIVQSPAAAPGKFSDFSWISWPHRPAGTIPSHVSELCQNIPCRGPPGAARASTRFRTAGSSSNGGAWCGLMRASMTRAPSQPQCLCRVEALMPYTSVAGLERRNG